MLRRLGALDRLKDLKTKNAEETIMSDLGNKEIMAENIQYYLDRQGITRQKMCQDLNISYTTLATWLQGKSYPRIDRIELMANYFHISKSDLVEKRLPDNMTEHDSKNVVRIPVIGTIACGDPIDADENIEEYRMEYFPGGVPSGKLIDLRCKGDSMEPTIPNGSIVVVRLQPEVENGEIAAVLVDGDTRATLKRVKYADDKVVLWPENQKYDPIWLDEKHPGRIIGKAIQYTAPL